MVLLGTMVVATWSINKWSWFRTPMPFAVTMMIGATLSRGNALRDMLFFATAAFESEREPPFGCTHTIKKDG